MRLLGRSGPDMALERAQGPEQIARRFCFCQSYEFPKIEFCVRYFERARNLSFLDVVLSDSRCEGCVDESGLRPELMDNSRRSTISVVIITFGAGHIRRQIRFSFQINIRSGEQFRRTAPTHRCVDGTQKRCQDTWFDF